MTDTITKALIYEAQGLFEDALAVYKNILKLDPNNKEAKEGTRRLGGDKNADMKELFLMMSSPEEIAKFKEWLIRL